MQSKKSGMDYTYSKRDFTNLRQAPEARLDADDSMAESSYSARQTDDDTTSQLPPPTSVAAVRSAMSNTRLAAYLAEFDAHAVDNSRVMCSVPAGVVDDTARAQLLAAGVDREDDAMHHQNELEHIDQLKRNRILELEAKRRQRREDQRKNLRNIELQRQQTSELVDTYYDQAQRELDIHLTARQGEVSQAIGEIRHFRRGDYDPDKPDWKEIEQQVQIGIVKVEGVKNKIPEGEYLMLISKWDKMGGQPLRWSNRDVNDRPGPPCPLHGELRDLNVKQRCEVCKGWAGGTIPRHHSGDPRAYRLQFDSIVYTFFQAQTRVKPYNCLMFELVRLPDKGIKRKLHETEEVLRPKVVGWGAIPIVDAMFNVINGKFRIPLLRGPYKPNFGHYTTVQNYLSDNLENWLGNVYLEIYPMAREHFGRNEFTLQHDFTTKLLALQGYGSAKDPNGWPYNARKRGLSLDLLNGNRLVAEGGGGATGFNALGGNFGDDFAYEEEFPYQRPRKIEEMDTRALTLWGILRVSILDRQRQKRLEEQLEQKEAVKRIEEDEKHRFAIHPRGATSLLSEWRIQVEYCIRAIKDEVAPTPLAQVRTVLVALVFLVSLYVQLYIHSMFIYLMLLVLGVPVDRVNPEWYGLDVQYLHRQTKPLEEIAIAMASMLSLYLTLLAEIGIGGLIRFATGQIPEQLSVFVFLASLVALLIPFFEIGMDGILGRRQSDWFRLMDFFSEHDYGWQYTTIAFLLLYCCMFAGCVVSTFLYTMGMHLNGILQDAYWRIVVVDEKTCHIPDDLEVSLEELRYIIRKAEQWRGKNGERRKVSVWKMITSDDLDPEYERVDLHIQLCTINCGVPERYLAHQEHSAYREFFVRSEGIIVEVREDSSPQGVSFLMNKLAKKFKLGGGFKSGENGVAETILALFGGAGDGGAQSMNKSTLSFSGEAKKPKRSGRLMSLSESAAPGNFGRSMLFSESVAEAPAAAKRVRF